MRDDIIRLARVIQGENVSSDYCDESVILFHTLQKVINFDTPHLTNRGITVPFPKDPTFGTP